jgi:hypothetical protein
MVGIRHAAETKEIVPTKKVQKKEKPNGGYFKAEEIWCMRWRADNLPAQRPMLVHAFTIVSGP